jgi:T6SS, Transcription factor, DNA binding domain
MHPPPLDPSVADLAPSEPGLTLYDEEHLITYLRMLDADADNADWHEVARLVLHIDPILEPDRARRVFDSHVARAKWMASHGYRHLLRGSIAR